MKNFNLKSILLLGSFVLITSLSAQNIPNGVMPSAGDIVQSISLEAENIFEGDNGNGVTWDFSDITVTPLAEPSTSMYVTPDDTPFAANFPTANLAISTPTDNGTFYSYYMKQSGRLEYIGGESAGSFLYYDVNPQLAFDENLSGGSPVTDDYQGFADFSGTMLHTFGNQTFSIDASGTLILPSGTFNNAVRMVNVSERIDSTGNEMSSSVTKLNTTVYYWMVAGQVDPVMSLIYSEGESIFTFNGNTPVVTPIPLTKSALVNPDPNIVNSTRTPNHIDGLKVEEIFPNPTSDFANISMNIDTPQKVNISMTNLMGQTINQEIINLSTGEYRHQLDMTNFPSGTYLISITKNKDIISRKIIKE